MDFALTDEQTMLRDGATRYLDDNYIFEQRRAVLALPTSCSEAHWAAFAEMGWLALPLPESAGGLGGSLVDIALLMEAMGRKLVLEPYATTALLAARILEKSTAAQSRSIWLPQIAEGRLRIALADAESGDCAASRPTVTRAVVHGAGWRVTGTKVLAYDAPAAQQLIVVARIEPRDELALLLLPANAPGVKMQDYPLIDGTRAADIEFSDVSVDANALLLRGPEVAVALDEAADRLVLARVAESLGMMDTVMQLTAEHLRNRVQFGQPLAKFQSLQHRMSEMFVEVQETRSILYRGIANIDADAATRRAAVSAAKIVATQAARIVGGQGIQLHGGIGMTDEYAVGHYFKRLIAIEKSFGDLDTHLERLATSIRN